MNSTTNQWIKATGKLVYQPSTRFSLRKKRNIDETHTIVPVDNNLAAYARWWVDREIHLFLQPPMLGAHVSVFNGKETLNENAAQFLQETNGTTITYEYSLNVQQHWKFWVLPVRSNDLMYIRDKCGVNKNYHFHITIGRML